MNAAQLFVKCLESEGYLEVIFGIPGEENLAIMDALFDLRPVYVTTRATNRARRSWSTFGWGRLTGKAGVSLCRR